MRGSRSGTSRTKRTCKARLETLHAIEQGGNEMAEIAELISTAVLRRHLETMQRLDIEYDFLPRESEILHLHFWDLAFQQLKEKGVLYFETRRQEQGLLGDDASGGRSNHEAHPGKRSRDAGTRQETPGDGPDEDAKVIVRSNGTVGYVGKDIAYHLWKFGLLGRDFGYQPFLSLSQRSRGLDLRRAGRGRPSALWRRGSDLQRHRLAAERSAEHGDRSDCGCWATPSRRRTTRISPTRWSR